MSMRERVEELGASRQKTNIHFSRFSEEILIRLAKRIDETLLDIGLNLIQIGYTENRVPHGEFMWT